ncbi:MAG: glutamate 5-kinase [Candidatus Sumerlaeia bacterium]|nr:glutamate 5-kinase [Candidatus Sumerlaeia bacterium]
MPHRFSTLSLQQAWPFEKVPRRVVLKCGSNLLSTPQGLLDAARIAALADDVAWLKARGAQVVVVSSGAVAAGMGEAGETSRPRHLSRLQGLAAIGQSRLMSVWGAAFAPHSRKVAQILLTRADLEDRQRYLNIQATLDALLAMDAVPVLNENDSVITEELSVGDNDMLSAIVAAKLAAPLLVMLTDTDGLFTGHPERDREAKLVPVVERVTPELEALAQGPGSKFGRGGMLSKIAAARHATRYGVTAVVANGRRPGIVREIAGGTFVGTLFLPDRDRRRASARGHWISMRRPKGAVVVDDGARRALVENGSSLLPVGITGVRGTFSRGDTIAVVDSAGVEIALGLAAFSADEVERIKGLKAARIPEVLGVAAHEEVVHRDNLILKG